MRFIVFTSVLIILSSCTTSSKSPTDLIQVNHASEASEVDQSKKLDTQSLFYKWHDKTKGGLYAIGDGWSIELDAAQYGYETHTYLIGERHAKLKIIPAEYEWVKDNTEDLSGPPEMKTVLVPIPAEYMTITETVVLELAKTEYYFQDAKYSSNGNLLKPKTIGLRNIPAVTKEVIRRVVKTPPNTEERQVPIERKRGFRYVLKTPTKVVPDGELTQPPSITFPIQIEPWKFMVKNPKGQIVHTFDDFNALKIFIDSLKEE